jgi:hypothetical protein
MNIFLLFSAILWVAGFLSMKGIITLNTNPIFEMNKVIVPPKWLYYLCGAPKSEKYISGAITVGAMRAQLAGIVMGIFSIIISTWKPTLENMAIGLSLCFLIPYSITLWISRNERLSTKYKCKKRKK